MTSPASIWARSSRGRGCGCARGELQQQPAGVAVGGEGVLAGAALSYQLVGEEPLHSRWRSATASSRSCSRPTASASSDVLDLPGLEQLLRGLHTRELSLVEVETQRASPFASSLLFDYVATYMYEGDTPNAERRAAALSLDRDLLRELLGQEELRDLIDPAALDEVEADLQRLSERTRAANADGLHDVLRALGDLTADEAQARCLGGGRAARMLGELEKRAARRSDADRGRGALDRVRGRRPVPRRPRRRAARRPAGGVPGGGWRSRSPGSPAATRAPTGPSPRASAARYGVDRAGAARAGARGRAGARRAAPGRQRARVVRHGRAAPPAARLAGGAAQGGQPAEQRALARFLPAWQGIDARRRAAPAWTGCARCSCRSRAWRWRPRPGSATCSRAARAPTRPPGSTSSARAASSSGSAPARSGGARAVWRCTSARTRAGSARRRQGRAPARGVHDVIRERLGARRRLLDRPAGRPHGRRAGRAPGGALGSRGAGEVDERRLRAAARAAAVAGAARPQRRPPLRPPAPRRRAPQVQGRWSLTAPLFADAPAHGPRMRATRELLLERHGIVTRETVLAEGVPGGFAALYSELTNLETLGTARRGYFVEGLGGAQFALPRRSSGCAACAPTSPPAPLVLAATDPANPYGATLPWPKRERLGSPPVTRAGRVRGDARRRAGALPRARRQGTAPLREPDEELAAARARGARRRGAPRPRASPRRGALRRRAGGRLRGGALLVELGFRQGPRKLTLSA